MADDAELLQDDEARRWLLHATGLAGPRQPLSGLLERLRCVQLDPLDPVGCNADLVAMARTPAREGELFAELWPEEEEARAFEHYAKERCLLPADAFPAYRGLLEQRPGWRQSRRMQRLNEAQLDAVEDEVRERGPVAVADLGDHGRVDPLMWSTWKGTGKAATLAAEVLVLRCRLVVCGRRGGRDKIVDLPERALPTADPEPDVIRRLLSDRVAAMGLLPTSGGPWWGGLEEERHAASERGLREGWLELVALRGSRRRWLAPAGFRERIPAEAAGDGTMRILGPLDPLLWDRWLVKRVFDFEYVWEVYKPAEKRRWGWYVCPLLHGGRLVGRFEGRRGEEGVELLDLWPEKKRFSRRAFAKALALHGERLRPRVSSS